MSNSMEIAEKRMVTFSYRGTLADGSLFDASQEEAPLQFIFATGQIIPGPARRGRSAGFQEPHHRKGDVLSLVSQAAEHLPAEALVDGMGAGERGCRSQAAQLLSFPE